MRFYLSFPIHDHTGDPLSEEEASAAREGRHMLRCALRWRGAN